MTRTLDELLATEDPAWPAVRRMALTSPERVEVLPVPRATGEQVLHRLQVGADSALGAMALGCGGMLLDHGWLRLLGGGSEHLADLASGTGLRGHVVVGEAGLVVAHDVLGGRYALGRPEASNPGDLAYWAPDSLAWDPLEMGYSAFLSWVLEVGTGPFYRDWRWPAWETEVDELAPDEGLLLDPPPWTPQGRDVAATARRRVPLAELVTHQERAGDS